MTQMAQLADPYYSRNGARWELAEREDPVVWGEGRGPWPQQDVDQYREQGYFQVGHLLETEEATALRREAERLAAETDPRAAGVITEPGSQAIRSLFRLHRSNHLFQAICRDARIVDAARQLLGSDVYIHQSRINFKPAFSGKEFFWHSDFETWHIEDGMPRMRAVSVSINLTENHEFNGPLMVVPRSHQLYVRCVGQTPDDHYQQSLKKQQYGVPSVEAMRELVQRGGIRAPKGRPGSALFFECNTMHGSVGNLSPEPRINLFVVYNSVENRLQQPFGDRPPRPAFLAERDTP